MKKLLSLCLIFLAAPAMAQEAAGKGCRILIGEDWIPMGATTVSGCLKYAEAAATPGERQFAQFDAINLTYMDGKSFQSTDGGKTWQAIQSSSGTSVGALNTLRTGPAEPSAAPPAKSVAPPPAVAAAPAAPAPAAALPASPPAPAAAAPVMPDLEAPVPLADSAPAAPQGSQSAALAAPAQAPLHRSAPAAPAAPAPAPAAPAAQETAAPALTPSVPSGCQVRVGERWQVVPVASVEECGRVLINIASKAQAKSSQAYWSGNYLFYSNRQLFYSTNGNDWLQLNP